MITKICEQCKSDFVVRLTETKRKPRAKDNSNYGRFCSNQCACKFKEKRTFTSCTNCGLEFTIKTCRIRDRNFCCKSCAATYNNTHKTHGTRRSKLESYLEQQLRSEFPNLEIIFNGKDAIGSELDFYFPQLRLAIELNGIFHYEPIYGTDKLERIQANDQQKSLRCAAAGIEFCTIDVSIVNNVTNAVKERYWTIVRSLVVPLLERADDTNVQVS